MVLVPFASRACVATVAPLDLWLLLGGLESIYISISGFQKLQRNLYNIYLLLYFGDLIYGNLLSRHIVSDIPRYFAIFCVKNKPKDHSQSRLALNSDISR